MQFSGTVEIDAPRDKTWAFLIDPERVASCGPGVESVEELDDRTFRVRAKVGVGFISAKFVVNMSFGEMIEPDKATVRASGQAPGSAVDAVGEMNLSGPPEGPTTMDWKADVDISGSLAGVGARLMEGTATKIVGQTFDCIKAKLEG